LTRKEGYRSADIGDRWVRWLLRLAALTPLVGAIIIGVANEGSRFGNPRLGVSYAKLAMLAYWVGVAGSSPMPLLLFLRLRGLAKRARSAHLAEHCMIVGIGAALSTLAIAVAVPAVDYFERSGRLNMWSPYATAMGLLLAVSACLFGLWTLYLLVRFAIAFLQAGRLASQKWKRDDLTLVNAV